MDINHGVVVNQVGSDGLDGDIDRTDIDSAEIGIGNVENLFLPIFNTLTCSSEFRAVLLVHGLVVDQ